MTTYLEVRPAFGVLLNTQQEVRYHYNENKDFEVLTYFNGGRYISKMECEQLNCKLEVRYGKDERKVMVL